MLRNMGKRMNLRPGDDDDDDIPTVFRKHSKGGTRVGGNKKRVFGIWSLRFPKKNSGLSPVTFLKRIGAEVARALRSVSIGRRSSGKVSSASLARTRSYVEPLDSHRAEAIEDCIEFLNSSSSLQRSNSVPNTSSCYSFCLVKDKGANVRKRIIS